MGIIKDNKKKIKKIQIIFNSIKDIIKKGDIRV